ncbi:hypothetical protein FOA52_002274 [Chlamydomonas sp. UWO 241]|nr:hypothetical protein FOA52_002274 [Chlamydomonas sp. UWO 241]
MIDAQEPALVLQPPAASSSRPDKRRAVPSDDHDTDELFHQVLTGLGIGIDGVVRVSDVARLTHKSSDAVLRVLHHNPSVRHGVHHTGDITRAASPGSYNESCHTGVALTGLGVRTVLRLLGTCRRWFHGPLGSHRN